MFSPHYVTSCTNVNSSRTVRCTSGLSWHLETAILLQYVVVMITFINWYFRFNELDFLTKYYCLWEWPFYFLCLAQFNFFLRLSVNIFFAHDPSYLAERRKCRWRYTDCWPHNWDCRYKYYFLKSNICYFYNIFPAGTDDSKFMMIMANEIESIDDINPVVDSSIELLSST